MPTYDYSCELCGHAFEQQQKITESPLADCPHCSQKSLKRGIGGGSATFRFIGEGFYINDHKDTKKECAAPSNCCPCKD